MNTEQEEIGLLSGEDNLGSFEENDDSQDHVVLERSGGELKQKFEKPDNIPDEFWDEEKGTYNANEVLKAYEEEKEKALNLRQRLSKGFHNVPKSPDHYQLEDIEDGDEADNEQLKAFKQIAHKNGLTQEQFSSLVKDFGETFPSSNPAEPQIDEDRVQAIYQTEMAKLGDSANQYIDTIRSWGKSLVKTGAITQEEYGVLTNMPVRAEEIKLLDKLRGISGFIRNIPDVESIPDDGESRAEIERIMSDPKFESDPVLQRKVSNYFKKTVRD